MKAGPTIEICLPVLNEEATLWRQVETFWRMKALLGLQFHYSLVIVDNGSSDGTDRVAKEVAQEFQRIRVMSLPLPGVGRAVKAAWDSSEADLLGLMDLDFSTSLKHLRQVEDGFMGGADVIVGSRHLPASRVIGLPTSRRLISRILHHTVRLTTARGVSDAMCGFKFVRAETWPTLKESGASLDGWFLSGQIAIVASRLGMPYVEIPVEWRHDADSRVRLLRHSFEITQGLRATRQELKRKS